MPGAAAELVEGGIPRDPEEPGPRSAAAPVELSPLAPSALERLRGDLLGGGTVTEQPGDVGIDVVPALPVERLEGDAGLIDLPGGCRDSGSAHTGTTEPGPIHHTSIGRAVKLDHLVRRQPRHRPRSVRRLAQR